jgi:SAM-dependent MidA family methyltransferase
MGSPLPPPGDEACAVSQALTKKIGQAISDNTGCLPFDDFMGMALYEPGLGYYSNGLTPFGEQGDFITAPESGQLFGRCLARSIASVLAQLDGGDVLELGAGSGVLAGVVIEELQRLGVMPRRYLILERTAAMRDLQQKYLRDVSASCDIAVEWLDQMPDDPIDGVVFGNEVADALPVNRFRWQDGQVECHGVGWDGKNLSNCSISAKDSMTRYVCGLAQDYGWQTTYQSEYCPSLSAWVSSLSGCVGRGVLMLIDYGYGRAEYYHPQRTMGTLMCHYRHQAHPDPLWYPGLQDITAFVDFTTIAEAATDAGMGLLGYTSQAQFLMGCGIDTLLSAVDPEDTRRYLMLSNEAKRLMLPSEMGERFKVIGFSRGLGQDMLGFTARDLRSRL